MILQESSASVPIGVALETVTGTRIRGLLMLALPLPASVQVPQ